MPKCFPYGGLQAFAAISYHRGSFSEVQSLGTNRVEIPGQDLFVFWTRFLKLQHVFVATYPNAHGPDPRHFRKLHPIKKHGHDIQWA